MAREKKTKNNTTQKKIRRYTVRPNKNLISKQVSIITSIFMIFFVLYLVTACLNGTMHPVLVFVFLVMIYTGWRDK